MSDKINTRVLSGFIEFLPAEQIAFNKIKDSVQTIYESAGFSPLDTPAIERQEILLDVDAGETGKQIYLFEKGDNKLGLRFDLTVPFARYVADHYGALTFPFRRYHIGKSYRGERPQKGRYREFYQADIDVVNDGDLPIYYDAEIISVMANVYQSFIPMLGEFTVSISTRKIWNGVFDELKVAADKQAETLVIIDKADKVSLDTIKEMLLELVAEDQADAIVSILDCASTVTDFDSVAAILSDYSSDVLAEGIADMKAVFTALDNLGVGQYCRFDLRIIRGLGYYTGTVFEIKLNDYPGLGSVGGGGRYENLCSRFMPKSNLQGVGGSIGISRVFEPLIRERKVPVEDTLTFASVVVLPMGDDAIDFAMNVLGQLRQAGVSATAYLDPSKKFKKQMGYADKQGVSYAVIIGEDEVKSSEVTLKDMKTGDQETLSIEALLTKLQK